MADSFRSSLVAYRYIDRKGRRWLLMLSLAAMFPFLLATAFSFHAPDPPNDGPQTGLQTGLVATFLVLYTIVSPFLTISFTIHNMKGRNA